MERRHGITVAVVGAGASGALAVIQLLRQAEAAGARIDIRLIDPSPSTGHGVAYDTTHPLHICNIPASKMGAVAGDPDHFSRWIDREKRVGDPDAFVPRAWFGEYVEASLAESLAASRSRVERVRARVTEIQRRHVDSTVRLDRGPRFRASHVVLAVGSPSGPNQLLPSSLLESRHFVGDPWAPDELDAVAASRGDVLLLGTGLTMVDVALRVSRPDRSVFAVSRRGLTPEEHLARQGPSIAAPYVPDDSLALEELPAILVGQMERARRRGRCWQDAVDSLRPVTNELWGRLSPADQRRFVAGPMRAWEVLRHRMAPEVAERFWDLVHTGAVVLSRGEIADAVDVDGAVDVVLADGTVRRVSSVVSCTGASSVRSAAGPLGDLVRNLEYEGTVVLHPLGTGLVTDERGRACTPEGEVRPPVYVIGPLRRGSLWETTAIPEILEQSDEVARHIVADAPLPRLRRHPEDLYGVALSTTGEAADMFNEGLGRLLRVQSGAHEAIQRSVELDPMFALGHAALAMMAHELDLGVDPSSHLELAEHASSRGATTRERELVKAIGRRIDGDSSGLIRHVQRHPRDVLAISIAVPTIAFSGAYELSSDAWDLLEGLVAHYQDDWWFDGLLAFARQDQEHFEEARELAGRSLRIEPRGGTAAHALAHAHFETGEHETGLEWLDPWISVAGRDATHLAHFSWHAALFELALGDTPAVVARLRSQLMPGALHGTRLIVDTASLLWRLLLEDELSPLDTSIIPDLAGGELWDPSTPFSAMHAVVTWALVGDLEELQRLERRCRQSESVSVAVLVAPLATALRLFLTGRYDEAATVLMSLLPNLAPLGGSAAQREIVEDTALAALVRAGDGTTAASLLDRRLARRLRPKDLILRERADAAVVASSRRGTSSLEA